MDHTDEYIKEISEKIDSNKIWEFAEPRFQEYRSSELLQHVLKQAGFSIKADLAGEKTAFIAEYGSGKPVIAFLGEFDALPGLSQKADAAERIPVHTDSCDRSGDNVLGWNNQDISIIETAWDQMACYWNTVRMDTCGTFDSSWQTDKACI